MLERIINIAPGSDYKNSSSRTNRYQKSSQFLNELHSSVNDSVSLSPATAFLSAINWKLKKFQNEKEKYVITFDFDGFEFTAHVGQPDLVITHNMEYHIKKIIEKIGVKHLTSIHLNTPHFVKQSGSIDVKDKLPYLSEFTNNMVELFGMAYLVKADSIEVKKIFYEKEKLIRMEFDYLNNCLVNFLEKYLSMKFNNVTKNLGAEDVLSLLRAQVEKI